MANTLPTGPETISEDGTSIDVYLFNLVTGYDSSGASHMDQCTVRELHLCKEQTSVGHEYISVQVLRGSLESGSRNEIRKNGTLFSQGILLNVDRSIDAKISR